LGFQWYNFYFDISKFRISKKNGVIVTVLQCYHIWNTWFFDIVISKRYWNFVIKLDVLDSNRIVFTLISQNFKFQKKYERRYGVVL